MTTDPFPSDETKKSVMELDPSYLLALMAGAVDYEFNVTKHQIGRCYVELVDDHWFPSIVDSNTSAEAAIRSHPWFMQGRRVDGRFHLDLDPPDNWRST